MLAQLPGPRGGRDPHPASGEHRTALRAVFDFKVWMDGGAGVANDLCLGPFHLHRLNRAR